MKSEKQGLLIALITIGQSPRDDVVPEMISLFPSNLEIIEAGLLDGLTQRKIESLQPQEGETPLVSRLRDGTAVLLGEQKILRLLPSAVEMLRINKRIDAAGMLCTHDFPKIKTSIPVIYLSDYIRFIVERVLQAGSFGIVVPLDGQKAAAEKKWTALKTIVVVKNPYVDEQEWKEVARVFSRNNVDAVLLDCIGYRLQDQKAIQEIVSVPVLLPRQILASALHLFASFLL